MKLEPIAAAERLYLKVARRVAALITSGEVKPGDKLPAERQLAEMLQVSRPTIREAMIALEVSGIIEVRTGSGIYVTERGQPAREVLLKDEGIGPFDLFELRLMIEPEAAALAAERMRKGQIEALRSLVEEMSALDASPELEQVDQRFHVAIAEGTENAATVGTLRWLWKLRQQSELSRGFHRMILGEGIFPVIEEHRAIADAIAARDPQAARAAMRAHIEASIQAAATHFGGDA